MPNTLKQCEEPQADKHYVKGLLAFFWMMSILPLFFLYHNDNASSKQKGVRRMVAAAKGPVAHKLAEKTHSAFSISIDLQEEDVQANTPFTLKGSVESKALLTDVQINWVLPQGVQIIKGAALNSFAEMSPSAPKTVEITLITQSEDNTQIHLNAIGFANGSQRGGVAQFNTSAQIRSQGLNNGPPKSLKQNGQKKRIIF